MVCGGVAAAVPAGCVAAGELLLLRLDGAHVDAGGAAPEWRSR